MTAKYADYAIYANPGSLPGGVWVGVGNELDGPARLRQHHAALPALPGRRSPHPTVAAGALARGDVRRQLPRLECAQARDDLHRHPARRQPGRRRVAPGAPRLSRPGHLHRLRGGCRSLGRVGGRAIPPLTRNRTRPDEVARVRGADARCLVRRRDRQRLRRREVVRRLRDRARLRRNTDRGRRSASCATASTTSIA